MRQRGAAAVGSSAGTSDDASLLPAAPRYASPAAAMSNAAAAGGVRAAVAVAAAVALGLSGRGGAAGGVAAFLGSHAAASAALLARMRCAPGRYFPGVGAADGSGGALAWAASGLADNAVLFVFAWTLAYTFAHVYRDSSSSF
jgi:hypothetical protein